MLLDCGTYGVQSTTTSFANATQVLWSLQIDDYLDVLSDFNVLAEANLQQRQDAWFRVAQFSRKSRTKAVLCSNLQ